jgi:hypothetical protein
MYVNEYIWIRQPSYTQTVYFIIVRSDEGLDTLNGWLNDHLLIFACGYTCIKLTFVW